MIMLLSWLLLILRICFDDFLRNNPLGYTTVHRLFFYVAMCTLLIHFQFTEKKTLSIEEKMEEIRIVNRAKWLLISELKLDEPEAHRYIEKQAMDRCVSKRVVAEEVIKTYS